MKPLHPLLKRQMQLHLGEVGTLPSEWRAFVEAVDEAYRQAEDDREIVPLRPRRGDGCARPAEATLQAAATGPQEESERLLALHRASTLLTVQTAEPDAVLDEVLRSAVELLGGGSGSLYRWDDQAELLRCVRNWQVPASDTTPDVRPGEGLAGQTFDRGEPLVVNDYSRWDLAMRSGRIGGLRAGLGVPLRHAGRTIGVLLIRSYRDDTPPFTEADARLASLFADKAAIAIENARLYQDLEARVARLRTLTHLNRVISASLDTDRVLNEIARAAATLVDAPLVSFWLVDRETQTLEARALSDPMMAADFPARLVSFDDSGVGWVARHRRPLDVPDVFADGRYTALEWWRKHGLSSSYAMPILHEDELLAVIALCGREPFHFGPDEQDLLDSLIAQAAVAIRNAQLYETIASSNQALEVAALRASELAEAARAADRAKSEFLGRVSHELRTPLNAILGFAQVLEMSELSEEDQDSVGEILRGGQHLLGLIDEVLDIASMETGRLDLSLEPVRVVEAVREAINLVRPLAAEQGIRLEADLGPAGDRCVPADARRLKQVLLNLLSNGVKFNQAGGSVTVSCRIPDEGRLRLLVRDTGHGIPADKMARLFSPFDRLEAEQLKVEGVGLGLTLSKGLIEAMSGEIGAESEPGRGSTFWIELAVAEGPPPT